MAFFAEIQPYGPTVSVTYLPVRDGDPQVVECIASMWGVTTRLIIDADDCRDLTAHAEVADDGARVVWITGADGTVLASEILAAETFYLGRG